MQQYAFIKDQNLKICKGIKTGWEKMERDNFQEILFNVILNMEEIIGYLIMYEM
jgi:hypothetical protein